MFRLKYAWSIANWILGYNRVIVLLLRYIRPPRRQGLNYSCRVRLIFHVLPRGVARPVPLDHRSSIKTCLFHISKYSRFCVCLRALLTTYFILVVLMRDFLMQHTCMSCTFSIAIYRMKLATSALWNRWVFSKVKWWNYGKLWNDSKRWNAGKWNDDKRWKWW